MLMSLESSKKLLMKCNATDTKTLQQAVVRRKVLQADSWHLKTS